MVYDILRENNCYVNEHKWKEDQWDTINIGFMVGLNPQSYTSKQATDKLIKEIMDKVPAKTKIPKFKLSFVVPWMKEHGYEKRTKAYAIKIPRNKKDEMIKVLTTAFRENQEFVAFPMRTRDPDTYVGAIDKQNEILNNSQVIILNNIGTDAMFSLENRLLGVSGILDVLPTRYVDKNGDFKLLTTRTDFYVAQKEIKKHLHDWYIEYVPEDIRSKQTDKFTNIPQVSPIDDDKYSSGDDSYNARRKRSYQSSHGRTSTRLNAILRTKRHERSRATSQDNVNDSDSDISQSTTSSTSTSSSWANHLQRIQCNSTRNHNTSPSVLQLLPSLRGRHPSKCMSTTSSIPEEVTELENEMVSGFGSSHDDSNKFRQEMQRMQIHYESRIAKHEEQMSEIILCNCKKPEVTIQPQTPNQRKIQHLHQINLQVRQSGDCNGRGILPRPSFLRATQPARLPILTSKWRRWYCT